MPCYMRLMMQFPNKHPRRMAILAEGPIDIFRAKTTAGIVRYCRDEVVGILNSSHAGTDMRKIFGVGTGIPIVKNLSQLDKYKPNLLVLGIAIPGGEIPENWRVHIREAIYRKMDIVNGLHTMLNKDSELLSLAKRYQVQIFDIRQAPKNLRVGMGRTRNIEAKTVLTVGSDCNVGKKICALELDRECQKQGKDSIFIPTGQTGVIIAGRGVVIDRIIADFVSGAVEEMILAYQNHEWLFIEGQGALLQVAYSGVTLSLLHGALPKAMILCHHAQRRFTRHNHVPIPPMKELIQIHEALVNPIQPSKVVGIASNCHGLTRVEAHKEIARLEGETGLPATDVIQFGAGKLLDALTRYFSNT